MRPLSPVERLIDLVDRASSLNFTTIATISGRLSADKVARALHKLQLRQPLLGMRLERIDGRPHFIPDVALRVPIQWINDTSPQRWVVEAEAAVNDGRWPADKCLVRMTVIAHGAERYTLMLHQNHRVSDGLSGAIAMRDLVRFLNNPAAPIDPQSILPLEEYQPPMLRGARGMLRSLQYWARKDVQALLRRPTRLPLSATVPPAQRRVRIIPLILDPVESASLASRAHEQGTTVHGALTAALLLATHAAFGLEGNHRLQAFHPVNQRAALARLLGDSPLVRGLDSRMGYLVGSVETANRISNASPFWQLAREVTSAIRKECASLAPFAMMPLLTAAVPLLDRWIGPERFGAASAAWEPNAFGLSNLGVIALDPTGEYRIEDLHFGFTPSLFGPFAAVVATSGGCIRINLSYYEPTIDRARAALVAAIWRERLEFEARPDRRAVSSG